MNKKCSKLTALVLTLTMALSLALPAWAAENTASPPLDSPFTVITAADSYLTWEDFLRQYLEDRPDYYASFDADAFFAEEYFWETKEEFMKYMGLADEAAFKNYLWEYYLDDLAYNYGYEDDPLYREIDAAYDAYLIETYESRHPGELNRLKTEDLLANWGYTKTLSPMEQFMADQGLSSQAEVRPILLSDYAQCRLDAERTHVMALAYQELYPERWAGFDADAWFAKEYSYSWDSKKEYTDYYYLTTEEEFREDMFVDYVDTESWMWNLNWGGGTQSVTLTANGQPVDAVITVENGVSYTDAASLNAILGTQLTGDRVAIRPAAEAAGWDVVWNARNRQILLFHRDSLPQGDFTQLDTLMNRLLSAAKLEEGQSYKTTETANLKLTAFNSLDGDKTYTAQITAELLQKDNLYECTVTVNAADLVRLLPAQSQDLFQTQFGIQDLGRLLRSCKVTLLLNGETGMIYLNAPFLNLIDPSIPADTWYGWEIGTDAMTLTAQDQWNTSDVLYQALLRDSATSYWAEYAYYSYIQTQGMLGSLFGPQNFTERGGTLTWSMNVRSLQDLIRQEDEELAARIAPIFKEFEVKLAVGRNGTMTSDAVLRLDMDAVAQVVQDTYDAPDTFYTAATAWLLGLFDFRLESHASGTVNSSTSTASIHWKNQFKLEITGRTTRQKTAAEPRALPPAGSKVEFPYGPLGFGDL